MTTKEELRVVIDDVVSAILQKSTEILLACGSTMPHEGVEPIQEGVQTFEDVARMLASSVIERNKQTLIDAVPTPDSRNWPF